MSRSRSRSPPLSLPHNASPISESDYFSKNDEFRVWLKDEKHKYFDELTGDKARSYFRKFVKAWNRGKLRKSLYAGFAPGSLPARSSTSYKWSFNGADSTSLASVREEVGAETYSRKDSRPSGSGTGSGRIQGPTLPTAAERTLALELESEAAQASSKLKRKRERAEDRERVEDMVGPREVGREGALEKKRARREEGRAVRDAKDDAGLELDESTLMGAGGKDSFKAAIARRDAAQKRYSQAREERDSERKERASHYKEKEQATMDMFKQMAQARFG